MSTSNSVKLTKNLVEKLPFVKEGQEFYRDSELSGFGLRIGQTDKSYIVEGRVRGSQKKLRTTIGSFKRFTADEARDLAKAHLANMSKGINPMDELKEAKIKSITFKEAYDDYIKVRKLKPKTKRNSDYIVKQIFSNWYDKPLSEITRDMVLKRHQEIKKESGAAHADNAMERLRTIFNFAIPQSLNSKNEPIIKNNPVKILVETKALHKKKRKDSMVPATKLEKWFCAVARLEGDGIASQAISTRDLLILLILTGMRREEATRLKWKDVDFDEGIINLKDTKNHLNHKVPMSDFVYMILKYRSELVEGDFVFPSRGKHGYLIEPRKQMDKVEKLSGVEFSLHDLRRNYITAASTIVPAYALKKLANHLSNDVTQGYINYTMNELKDYTQKVTNYFLEKFGIKLPLKEDYLTIIQQKKNAKIEK